MLGRWSQSQKLEELKLTQEFANAHDSAEHRAGEADPQAEGDAIGH